MSSSSAAKAALRSGEWTESVDPKSGRKYFVNKKSKKTVWDLDKELSSNPGSAASSSAGSASPSSKPTGGGSTDPAVVAALKQGDWTEKVDPKSGKTYYYNKVTKATTWDLAKDLAAASPKAKPAETKAPASAAAAPGTSATVDGATAAINQVLAAGDWQEKSDPKSGKKYYYNKTTKKTTWDLVKELGLDISKAGPATATTAEQGAVTGSPTPPSYNAPSKPAKSYIAATVLANGEWKAGQSFNGTTYYLNTTTGETTADLQLFLDVQQALDNASDSDIEDGWKKLNGGRPMNDWLSLILRAPGHEEAADRLMAPYVQKRLTDAETAVARARRAEDAEREKNMQLEITVSELRKSLEAHQREVHQLQCAVFYGVGGGGGQNTATTHPASGLSKYVPAAIDPTVAHNPGSQNAMATRIEYLEKMLHAVQGHNVVLQEEIAELRRRGHEKATCQHCADNDAWRRVLDSAKGERPSLTASQSVVPSLTTQGFDVVAQRKPAVPGLQHHVPPPQSSSLHQINQTPYQKADRGNWMDSSSPRNVRWGEDPSRRHADPVPTPLPPNIDVLRYVPNSITAAKFVHNAAPSPYTTPQQPSRSATGLLDRSSYV